MRRTNGFSAVLDEPYPERPEVVETKRAIRSAAALLHGEVTSVQAWIDVMRDRTRDQQDPED